MLKLLKKYIFVLVILDFPKDHEGYTCTENQYKELQLGASMGLVYLIPVSTVVWDIERLFAPCICCFDAIQMRHK